MGSEIARPGREASVPVPVISMYCDEGVSHREAARRVGEGKKDVRVYEINMWENDELDFDIPEHAWNNLEYEYIFLHHVDTVSST